MDKKVKLLCFGAGSGATTFMEAVDFNKAEIVVFVDNDFSKQGKILNGIKIESPAALHLYDYDYIVITSVYHTEIEEQLLKQGINKNIILKAFDKEQKTARMFAQFIYQQNRKYLSFLREEFANKYIYNFGICSMSVLDVNRNVAFYKFRDYLIKGIDFVRISTVELISREIYNRNIEGAIAELGVYQGDFSAVLSHYFLDKKIYLFDTFSGFVDEDIDIERKNKYSNSKAGHLSDTNIDIVLNKIKNKNNCIIRKGYFPETAKGLENEVFSFVSIDVDLYQPTYEGLMFFYERLNKNGYILVHDYHFNLYSGVKEAIQKFCSEKNINYFPLSDYFGSVILIK